MLIYIQHTVYRESLAGRIFGKSTIFECLAEKVWRMNISAKGLSMVAIHLDGFRLANHLRFAKFAKLSPHQTFPLYGNF